jgi:hypothetical protein
VSPSLGCRTLVREQLLDTSQRALHVGRHGLKIVAQVVQQVRERGREEVLRPVRLVARLTLRLVECDLELSGTSLTVRLDTLVPPLEQIQAPLQIHDHLAPSLGEGECLFPGC